MGARPDAIARAYRAFAVPAPASLGVCTACCMDPALERAMLQKATADLTLHDVQEWLDAAFSDDMNRPQIMWILPRILDLLADGQDVARVGNEVALWRLRNAGFPGGWPADQVAAVRDACTLVLDRHLKAPTGYLDNVLCMIANSGLDIAPFLARLDALPAKAVADLLSTDWRHVQGLKIWRTAFWEDVPGRQAVWDWYLSEDLETRLRMAGSAGHARATDVADAIARHRIGGPPH